MVETPYLLPVCRADAVSLQPDPVLAAMACSTVMPSLRDLHNARQTVMLPAGTAMAQARCSNERDYLFGRLSEREFGHCCRILATRWVGLR